MGKKRILVTSARWQAALSCVQSLGRKGHEVHLLDERDSPHGYSRFCHTRLPAPKEKETDRFLAFLLRQLRDVPYDVLIPISDECVELVAEHEDAISPHVQTAVPDLRTVRLAQDKADTCRFAAEHGVLTPKTYYPRTLEEVERLGSGLAFPCVVKLPRGRASSGVFFPANAAALVRAFEERGRAGSWPFVQEFVEGDVGDFTAVCDRGRVLASFMFRVPVEYLIGGTPPYAFSTLDPAMLDASTRLVRALGWHGAIDLDFILARDGQPYLLEINPRLSGTAHFALKVGIDLPQCYVDLASGEGTEDHQRPYEEGLVYRTVFPAEIQWIKKDPVKHLRKALKHWTTRRGVTNVTWDDLPLTYRQARQALRILFRG